MKSKEHPYAEILRAVADGKIIQFESAMGRWITQPTNETLEDLVTCAHGPDNYRVNPDNYYGWLS